MICYDLGNIGGYVSIMDMFNVPEKDLRNNFNDARKLKDRPLQRYNDIMFNPSRPLLEQGKWCSNILNDAMVFGLEGCAAVFIYTYGSDNKPKLSVAGHPPGGFVYEEKIEFLKDGFCNGNEVFCVVYATPTLAVGNTQSYEASIQLLADRCSIKEEGVDGTTKICVIDGFPLMSSVSANSDGYLWF